MKQLKSARYKCLHKEHSFRCVDDLVRKRRKLSEARDRVRTGMRARMWAPTLLAVWRPLQPQTQRETSRQSWGEWEGGLHPIRSYDSQRATLFVNQEKPSLQRKNARKCLCLSLVLILSKVSGKYPLWICAPRLALGWGWCLNAFSWKMWSKQAENFKLTWAPDGQAPQHLERANGDHL